MLSKAEEHVPPVSKSSNDLSQGKSQNSSKGLQGFTTSAISSMPPPTSFLFILFQPTWLPAFWFQIPWCSASGNLLFLWSNIEHHAQTWTSQNEGWPEGRSWVVETFCHVRSPPLVASCLPRWLYHMVQTYFSVLATCFALLTFLDEGQLASVIFSAFSETSKV